MGDLMLRIFGFFLYIDFTFWRTVEHCEWVGGPLAAGAERVPLVLQVQVDFTFWRTVEHGEWVGGPLAAGAERVPLVLQVQVTTIFPLYFPSLYIQIFIQ
jgi:hypothetical protein